MMWHIMLPQLREVHHIYLTPDGRMAICGLRTKTVRRVACAIDAVLRARLPPLPLPGSAAATATATVRARVCNSQ